MESYLIGVLGGKGGVGKTTVASNLAVSFFVDSKKPTLLIDADPSSKNDMQVLIGAITKSTILDIANDDLTISSKTINEYVSKHQSGIDYLPFSPTPNKYNDVNPDALGKLLDKLLNIYSYIIVDCGDELNPAIMSIMERATLLLLVATQDILSIKHSKSMVENLQGLMYQKKMLRLVINKFDGANPLSPQMMQNNIGISVISAIHEDVVAATNSISKNRSVIFIAPKSLLSRSIYQLARVIEESGVLSELSSLTANVVDKKVAQKHVRKSSAINELKRRIHKALIDNMDLKKIDLETKTDPNKQAILYEKTKRSVISLLEKEDTSFLSTREERATLIKNILDEALALGPLEDMLADNTISEIMVNGSNMIYVEQNGKLTLSPYTFTGSQQLMGVIERILAPIGRRIDEKSPYTDARLQDGSRVHAIIPPLALNGPTLTIRKFKKEKLGTDDLIKYGSITQDIAEFFKAATLARLNIIISGGTGSGKTTLLNILSSMIPINERIITVEDSAELQLQQDHVVRLEGRPPNIEGEGEVTIRDLVKCTLRMRPDRIVVGEVRSGEALDMLQAMNTGHDGSLTTVHSNTPEDSIRRLETLVLMAGMDLPSKAIREQLASAVNLVVQQTRLSDGSRKVTYITEVSDLRDGEVILNDIFRFIQTGVDKNNKVVGKFVATGYIPKFVETLETRGIEIPKGLFSV